MNEVLDFFKKLFDSSDWPPRWHCGKWSEFNGWLYIISDLLIWSAYFTIPLIIIKYISRKSDANFVRLYFLFAAFILACGATHFLDAIAFWLPVYRFSALVRFITGILSWTTVFYLVKLLPIAFSLKTQHELEIEIEQRKKAEEEARSLTATLEQRIIERTAAVLDSEKKYRYLFINNPMPMWIIDIASFKFLDVNDAAINHYGYSREEFLSMTALDIRPDAEKERYKKADHAPVIGSDYFRGNWKHIKKDGTVIYVEIIAHDIVFEGKKSRFILSSDVTERLKAEEKQAIFTSIVNSSDDAIISKTLDGIITSWNRGAENLFGYADEEILGKHISILIPSDRLNEEQEMNW